jgi:Bacterial Ig domain
MVFAAFRRYMGPTIGLAGALLLLATASANAATGERFASPSGSGTECTELDPCGIETAVDKAVSGEEVTIEAGTYGSSSPLAKELEVNIGVTVHGEAGKPRPVIISKASWGITLEGEGATLSDLELIDATGDYGIYALGNSGTTIDHVIVHVSAAKAVACYPSEALNNSVCWSSGDEGVAATILVLSSATATMRNDTLIASGSGGDAVTVNALAGTTMTINLTNSIARGADEDIFARTEGKSTATIDADHSDYTTVREENGGHEGTIDVTPAGTSTNQTGAPAFVEEATGDFHETSSSAATIGRGIDSALDEATDLDGNPREHAGSTDIGAYELITPAPTCEPVGVSTAFNQPVTIQLACKDVLDAPLTYALVGAPTHGKFALDPATDQVLYTPSPGYAGADTFTYDSSSVNGTATPATVSITVAAPIFGGPELVSVPSVTGLSESTRTWREGGALPAVSATRRLDKPPVGTTFSFILDESASVTFKFTKVEHGRKLNGRCVAPTQANRSRRSCARTVTLGAFSFAGRDGANKVRFAGRLSSGRRLSPGSYTLLVTAAVPGARSRPKTLRFTITR